MKVALYVEDRDSGFIFLDVPNAPAECHVMDLTLAPGIRFGDIEDDQKVVWLASNTGILVVPRDTVNFLTDPFDKEWPIPTCTVCIDRTDEAYREAIDPPVL